MASAGMTVFEQFTKAGSIHRGLYKLKTMNDNKKSLFRNWQLIPNFFIAYLPVLVRCKTKGEVGAVCFLVYNWQLGAKLSITLRDGAVTLKGSHRMGDGQIFSKKPPRLFL